MRKFILLSVIVFFTSSCAKKEFIIMVEQPSKKVLDNLKVEVIIDGNNAEDINLKSTEISPAYITREFLVQNEGEHILAVKVNDTLFNFKIHYPSDKFIILSPYLKNGKINIGILKQKDKFIFH